MTGLVLLSLIVAACVVGFACWAHAAEPAPAWPDDEGEALEAAVVRYDNACILCRRPMPDEALEYVHRSRNEMWCLDLASCKAWRDEWMGAMP